MSSRGPRDFGQLARKISSRTTDLFAIALVAVILLYFGVEVTRWWRADAPPVAGIQSAALPLAIWDDSAALSLELNTGAWSLRRETVSGSSEEVSANAVERLRQMISDKPALVLPPVDASERQWLDRLRDWAPQERSDHGDVFVLGGPWPWIVATSPLKPGVEGDPVSADRRILGWALALPQADARWTLYVADRTTVGQSTAATGAVPLPTGARSLLTVRSETGGFVAFRSAESRRRCQDDWDRRLIAAGWVRAGDWLVDGGEARAIYQRALSVGSERLDALLSEAAEGTSGVGDWRRQSEQPGPR